MVDDSLTRGVAAENTFHSTFPFKRFHVSSYDQRIKHIDARISDPHHLFNVSSDVVTFEIKAKKRIHRHDLNYDDHMITLELMGIYGHPGWIFSKADYIAFQLYDDGWLCIHPSTLIDLILPLCNIPHIACLNNPNVIHHLKSVTNPTYAINGHVYRRYGRLDLITRVPLCDIKRLKGALHFDKYGRPLP
tara:strand:+ start:70 stop:639 length:570 start_codon:yes stop_codon:yes gene_type:complete